MLAGMDIVLVLVALGSAFCFALALVLTQLGLRALAPMPGACISVPTTAALFVLLAPATVDAGGWRAGSAVLFALAGLFFPAAVTLLTFAANRRIGPNLTGALGNTTPLFAVGVAVVLLGEAPRAAQLAGIAAVCLGVALLFVGRARSVPGAPVWALALPLAAAAVRGLVQPVVKIGLEGWPDPFAAATIGYLVSALVIVTLARARGAVPRASAGRGAAWFVAVGLANGAAVLGLYVALARGPVTVVAPLVACYPLFTLALNRLVLGDRTPAAPLVPGVALTVAGVALILLA
jgi:drug/metabolite transporter (DMT)-like permease